MISVHLFDLDGILIGKMPKYSCFRYLNFEDFIVKTLQY